MARSHIRFLRKAFCNPVTVFLFEIFFSCSAKYKVRPNKSDDLTVIARSCCLEVCRGLLRFSSFDLLRFDQKRLAHHNAFQQEYNLTGSFLSRNFFSKTHQDSTCQFSCHMGGREALLGFCRTLTECSYKFSRQLDMNFRSRLF